MAGMFSRVRARALFALSFVTAMGAACHEGIDTDVERPQRATLGDEIYGVLCDRIGAGAFPEDLTGESYRDVCHYGTEGKRRGKYADEVDVSKLPPLDGLSGKSKSRAVRARELSLAKMGAMARRRGDLVKALNELLPDVKIDDRSTEKKGDKVEFYDALMSFGQTLAPLYESNPFDPKAAPLFPANTRGVGRVFDDLSKSKAAGEVLMRLSGREGYRPAELGFGAVRPALSYGGLAKFAAEQVKVLGPGGTGQAEMQQLLTVAKRELETSRASVSLLPPLEIDAERAQPSRPRSNAEFAAALLLHEDPAYAKSDDELPRFVARRDRRGFVLPAGADGAGVPEPFSDADGDGLADVDAHGRFVGASGEALDLPPPFVVPGKASGPVDVFGRPEGDLYEYIDTSRTLLAAMTRQLSPLLDPTRYAPEGDPEAYKSESETLMYAVAGSYLLFGGREAATYDWETESVKPAGAECASCVPYVRFRGEDSPLPGLVHAAGQVLADRDSDAMLLSMMDLMEKHEGVLARLVAAALRVREIAIEHDARSAEGKEPFAVVPYETPVWDEVAEVAGRIAQRPGLTRKLLESLADPQTVKPVDGSAHMGEAIATQMEMRDELTYDPLDVNGPPLNLTEGGSSHDRPKNPVDRSQPLAGDNRSIFQRTIQGIADTSGVKACNKKGAKVFSVLGGYEATFPPGDGYDECELFQMDDVASFYLGSLLPAGHPKRSKMSLKPSILEAFIDFLDLVYDANAFLEDSAGIVGMTLKPTPQALNRLVFFGTVSDEYGLLPDYDKVNANKPTAKFIANLMEPLGTAVCDEKSNDVRRCKDRKDLIRLRDANTLFALERGGFYDYLRPMATVFANEACSEDLSICDTKDYSGERLFADLVSILSRHWPGPDHGEECSSEGDAASNARYCSGAGLNTYEPILADAFRSDIVPALREFAVAATEMSAITVRRGPDAGDVVTGGEIMEKMTRVLFDPKYAAQAGMVDRRGEAGTTWTDGRPQAQVTVFSLFADALHGMDVAFDSACGCEGKSGGEKKSCEKGEEACRKDAELRRAQWKRARSRLVDEFLATEGEGSSTRFKNRSTAPMMIRMMQLLREQLNANCPGRESGEACDWAKKDLGRKFEEVVSGPVFAALMDVQDKVRAHEGARRELEKFLLYMLQTSGDGQGLPSLLASVTDLLQLVPNDEDLSKILNAVASAASPASDAAGAGAIDTSLPVLAAVASEAYDKYGVLQQILARLVAPMSDSPLTPLEVFMDVAAEVSRVDSSSEADLDGEDYETIFESVRDFMTHETRGLEQIYTIVQNRPRE